jgi:hypothetical protein
MAVNFSAWATYRRARIRVPQRCPQLVFRRSTQRERVRYGRVSATEASSRERGSISPCFKNLSELPLGRGSISSRFRNLSEPPRGGGRFRHVSKIAPSVSERGPISSRFKNLGGLSGEGVELGHVSECESSSSAKGHFASFSKKQTVGRAGVWTVERFPKTW